MFSAGISPDQNSINPGWAFGINPDALTSFLTLALELASSTGECLDLSLTPNTVVLTLDSSLSTSEALNLITKGGSVEVTLTLPNSVSEGLYLTLFNNDKISLSLPLSSGQALVLKDLFNNFDSNIRFLINIPKDNKRILIEADDKMLNIKKDKKTIISDNKERYFTIKDNDPVVKI